ncbi:MAG: hypothetical protein CL424_13910 [Acidimicrobiaceae bacterium]|nr:hypothetical protein [Acidimicrobiaceae bacterium]
MGIIERVKRLVGRGGPDASDDAETDDDVRIGDLSERLRQMRGTKTTAMGPGTAGPRSADSVEQLSKAARDGRYVDRTNEDDVLRGVKKYRSIDDR